MTIIILRGRYGDDRLPLLQDNQDFYSPAVSDFGKSNLSAVFIYSDFADRQSASRILEKATIIGNNQARIANALFAFESAVEFLRRKLWELNVSSLIPLRYLREEK